MVSGDRLAGIGTAPGVSCSCVRMSACIAWYIETWRLQCPTLLADHALYLHVAAPHSDVQYVLQLITYLRFTDKKVADSAWSNEAPRLYMATDKYSSFYLFHYKRLY